MQTENAIDMSTISESLFQFKKDHSSEFSDPKCLDRLLEACKYPVLLEIKGDFAEFSTGQTSPHRMTFPTMPPSVGSMLPASIMGRSCMKHVPLQIISVNKPRTIQITRNEPKEFTSKNDLRMQISHMFLRDVHYFLLIVPYVGFDSARETPKKFYDMLTRRVSRGEYHKPPCLGTSPCFARVSLADHPLPGHPEFNDSLGIFYGRKTCGVKKNHRVFRGLWSKDSVPVKEGVMDCCPWKHLTIKDLEDYLTLKGDYIKVKEDGMYSKF